MVIVSGISGAILFAIFAMIGYGFVDFLSFTLSKTANPFKMPMWNLTISVLVLTPAIFLFKFPVLTSLDILLLLIGTLSGAFATLAFYKALKMGKLAVVIPISNSWAIITVLVGLLLLNESLLHMQIYGIALTILGTIILSFKLHDIIKLKFDNASIGASYAFLSMIFWGIYFSSVGILAGKIGWYWPSYLTFLFSIIVLFAYNKFKGLDVSFPADRSKTVILQGILVAASFLVYNYSAALGFIAITGAITGSSPLPTLLLGRFLTKERMDANQLLGVAFVLVGIVLISL